MLSNPKLRYMAVGVHPELDTHDTRKLETQMEDPIIMIDTEDDSRLDHNNNQKV